MRESALPSTRPIFRRPATTTLVAGSLVALGIALTGVSWWFLALSALGAFGPGVLRELGRLADRDEFERAAAHRAGYHAFLATGIAGFLLSAFLRSGGRTAADASDVPTLLLAILWFTWLLSSLMTFWGPRTAAVRVLRVFGALWLVFAIVANVGTEWTGWSALLLHPLLAAPFFGLAWTAGRWPRATGWALLAAAVGLFQFLGLFRNEHLGLLTQGVTFTLLVGPLVASGIALAAEPRS